MNKYSVLVFIVIILLVSVVECGLFGRSQSSYGAAPNRMAYSSAGNSQYSNYNYNNNNNNNKNNANPNSNVANHRNQYFNQIDQHPNAVASKSLPRPTSSGLSAWGLITIIMLVIVIGMSGYYGVLCYPLICREERNYDIMDAASTTASANTPTRSSDFEKSGNYSSRSTTPSVIINT